MKKLIWSLLLVGIPAFASESQAIENWDTALPQIETRIIHMIETKALEEFYFEDDGVACGGQTDNFALTDYYTFESVEGNVTSRVKVKFKVTGAYDYCQGEVISECEAPLNIYTANHVSMGSWECTVVEAP